MSRESFKFYRKWYESMQQCNDKECGVLFRAIIQYGLNQEQIEIPKKLQEIFLPIKKDIDRDFATLMPNGRYHWNWKGGITSENHSIRESSKYKTWRDCVFERDNYTCRNCGKRGGKLEAHHIKPFSTDKRLRFELDNGITLCQECHKNLHKTERPWIKKDS